MVSRITALLLLGCVSAYVAATLLPYPNDARDFQRARDFPRARDFQRAFDGPYIQDLSPQPYVLSRSKRRVVSSPMPTKRPSDY